MPVSKPRISDHIERAQGGGRVVFQAGGGTLLEPPGLSGLKESNVLVICVDPDKRNAGAILERAKRILSPNCKEVKICRVSDITSDFTQHPDFSKVVEFSPKHVIFILPLEGYSDDEFRALNVNMGKIKSMIPDTRISIFYGNVLGDDDSNLTLSIILTNADVVRPVRECRNMVEHVDRQIDL